MENNESGNAVPWELAISQGGIFPGWGDPTGGRSITSGHDVCKRSRPVAIVAHTSPKHRCLPLPMNIWIEPRPRVMLELWGWVYSHVNIARCSSLDPATLISSVMYSTFYPPLVSPSFWARLLKTCFWLTHLVSFISDSLSFVYIGHSTQDLHWRIFLREIFLLRFLIKNIWHVFFYFYMILKLCEQWIFKLFKFGEVIFYDHVYWKKYFNINHVYTYCNLHESAPVYYTIFCTEKCAQTIVCRNQYSRMLKCAGTLFFPRNF